MQVLLRVISGWIKARLHRGFRAWEEAVHVHKRLFEKRRSAAELIDRVLGRITHASLNRAWNQWTSAVLQLVEEERKTAAHQSDASRRIVAMIRQWSHRQLSRGFRRWSSAILRDRGLDERRRWASKRMRRAILQIRRATLAAGWRTWTRVIAVDRHGDLENARRRRFLRAMLGKKHLSRLASLRLAFRRWHANGAIVATTAFYRDRFSRLKREVALLQFQSGMSRMRAVLSAAMTRGLAGAFHRWHMQAFGRKQLLFRRKLRMYKIVKRMMLWDKRHAFDKIRRIAMHHGRLRLLELEDHTIKRGMRTFIMVMFKTLQTKERLRLLRAFNRIFQYGMHLMHERISFLQKKHSNVVTFVRKLRREMNEEDAKMLLGRPLGGPESAPPIPRARKVPERVRTHPSTPLSPRTTSPIVRRGRQYRSHHEPSPPTKTSPSFLRRTLDESTPRRELFSRDVSPPPPFSSAADRAGDATFDFSKEFGDWRTAAERIRAMRNT